MAGIAQARLVMTISAYGSAARGISEPGFRRGSAKWMRFARQRSFRTSHCRLVICRRQQLIIGSWIRNRQAEFNPGASRALTCIALAQPHSNILWPCAHRQAQNPTIGQVHRRGSVHRRENPTSFKETAHPSIRPVDHANVSLDDVEVGTLATGIRQTAPWSTT